MPDFNFVDKPDVMVSQLCGHNHIGVDTEFVRERTFYAELCLVQIAAPDGIFCVDPLAGDDNAAFWEQLLDRLWITHSARQDIEVIYQTAERMPKTLFDTQIAAGLAGYAPQLGYAGLVAELFDVELPKSHTRADWSQRPLPRALLEYAAEDVEYLLPAYEALAESLEKQGRLDWARQDSALLLDPALYVSDPEQAIQRVKGAKNLRGRKRNAARRLAAWRERRAMRNNKPRRWILRDNVLVELANRLPATERDLQGIDGLPRKLAEREGGRLLAEIRQAGNDANNYKPPAAPDEGQKLMLESTQRAVEECAGDLGLPAEIIAPKRELSAAVVAGIRDSRVFQGWRKHLIGDRLTGMLDND